MTYFLGIDLGTTYTAAAVCRDGRAEIVGARATTPQSIPSVVLVRDDGEILVGEAAERAGRAASPTAWPASSSAASATRRRSSSAARRTRADALHGPAAAPGRRQGRRARGRPPPTASRSPTRPTGAPYKQRAARPGDARRPTSATSLALTEPEAAAIHYASQERVDAGAVVAVYDLGGGTFDAAVLRKHGDGFEILGEPEGIERLGGIDFDEAVFAHVRATPSAATLDQLDPDDPAVRRGRGPAAPGVRRRQGGAVGRHRRRSIPVLLPRPADRGAPHPGRVRGR